MRISDWSSDVCSSDLLESLARFVPELERARFWMTFGEQYITHLTVLQNVGMTSIDPVKYQGRDIIPLQFLAAVLPKPETLGETTKGNTNIGCIATGEALNGSGEKRSEEHTSELQSLMRSSYAVFCLKKKKKTTNKQ